MKIRYCSKCIHGRSTLRCFGVAASASIKTPTFVAECPQTNGRSRSQTAYLHKRDKEALALWRVNKKQYARGCGPVQQVPESPYSKALWLGARRPQEGEL